MIYKKRENKIVGWIIFLLLLLIQFLPLLALNGAYHFAEQYAENELGYHSFEFSSFPEKQKIMIYFELFKITVIISFVLAALLSKKAWQFSVLAAIHLCLYIIPQFIYNMQPPEGSSVTEGLKAFYYTVTIFYYSHHLTGILLIHYFKRKKQRKHTVIDKEAATKTN